MEAVTVSGVMSAGGGAGVGAGAGAPIGQASPKDVANFQQLLSGGSPVSTSQATSGVTRITPVAQSNLSSGISEGVKQAAEAYRSRFESLSAGLKKVEKSQSIGSLLHWQLESVKMGVEMEFTGKIASKLVQDIEQLTKQQG